MDSHLSQSPLIRIGLFVLIFVSLLTISCNESRSREIAGSGMNQNIHNISFEDLRSQPEAYDGKYVRIVGMCVRTDKRGGGTMGIIGKDPGFEIKVTAGEDVIRFSRYFEGRIMEVFGYVRDSDPVYTQTRNRESGDEQKRIYSYSKPTYHIECDRYRQIENESS